VAYCPTKEMVADFFMKPLQGSQFRKLREYIMNEPVKDASTLDSSAEPQESVEEVSNFGGSAPASRLAGSLIMRMYCGVVNFPLFRICQVAFKSALNNGTMGLRYSLTTGGSAKKGIGVFVPYLLCTQKFILCFYV